MLSLPLSRMRDRRALSTDLAASSLVFFLVTNFAVWVFSPMYAANAAGLLKCYVAAVPFLRNMLEGDLFWGLVLFGGYWLVQRLHGAKAGDLTAAAIALPAQR